VPVVGVWKLGPVVVAIPVPVARRVMSPLIYLYSETPLLLTVIAAIVGFMFLPIPSRAEVYVAPNCTREQNQSGCLLERLVLMNCAGIGL